MWAQGFEWKKWQNLNEKSRSPAPQQRKSVCLSKEMKNKHILLHFTWGTGRKTTRECPEQLDICILKYSSSRKMSEKWLQCISESRLEREEAANSSTGPHFHMYTYLMMESIRVKPCCLVKWLCAAIIRRLAGDRDNESDSGRWT